MRLDETITMTPQPKVLKSRHPANPKPHARSVCSSQGQVSSRQRTFNQRNPGQWDIGIIAFGPNSCKESSGQGGSGHLNWVRWVDHAGYFRLRKFWPRKLRSRENMSGWSGHWSWGLVDPLRTFKTSREMEAGTGYSGQYLYVGTLGSKYSLID